MLISIIGVSLNFTDITFLGTWILSFLAAYFFDELFNRKRLIERLRKQIADASQPDGHEKTSPDLPFLVTLWRSYHRPAEILRSHPIRMTSLKQVNHPAAKTSF